MRIEIRLVRELRFNVAHMHGVVPAQAPRSTPLVRSLVWLFSAVGAFVFVMMPAQTPLDAAMVPPPPQAITADESWDVQRSLQRNFEQQIGKAVAAWSFVVKARAVAPVATGTQSTQSIGPVGLSVGPVRLGSRAEDGAVVRANSDDHAAPLAASREQLDACLSRRALEDCRAALAVSPDDVTLNSLIAHRAAQQGDFDLAVRVLEPLRARLPEPSQRVLGAAYLQTGRGAEAVAVYQALLRDSPNDPALWTGVALALEKQGASDSSVRYAWQQLALIAPDERTRQLARTRLAAI